MKVVRRREKLQGELASSSMQQIHLKLHPGRILPKTVEEVGNSAMLEYLTKSGGYRKQKSLGLMQWILAHAIGGHRFVGDDHRTS